MGTYLKAYNAKLVRDWYIEVELETVGLSLNTEGK